jgi:hypothetical protein
VGHCSVNGQSHILHLYSACTLIKSLTREGSLMYAFLGGKTALEWVEPVVLAENLGTIRVLFFFLSRAGAGDGAPGEATITAASQEEIARATNLGRQAVKLALNRLLELGYLELLRPGCNGHARACYRLQPGANGAAGSEAARARDETGRVHADHAAAAEGGHLPEYHASTPPDSNNLESNNSPALKSPEVINPELTKERKVESGVESPALPASKAGRQTAEAGPGLLRWSNFLVALSRDYSRELGDSAHHRSNTAQTLNLWRKSGLDEQAFAARLYQARALTLRYAVYRPGEGLPPAGQPRNRMAYFFTVLRDLLSQESPPAPLKRPVEQEAARPAPVPNPWSYRRAIPATEAARPQTEASRPPAYNFRGAEALRQARRQAQAG